MTDDVGGGASRSTDPAAGSSAATDVSLREFLSSRLVDAEHRIDERDRYLREADYRLAAERDLRYQEQRANDLKLAEIRHQYDQRAIELQREVDKEHFAHLNEAAARSIEERSHFATRELAESIKESLLVFKEEINQRLDTSTGRSSGIGVSAGVLVTAIVAIGSLVGIAVAIVTIAN